MAASGRNAVRDLFDLHHLAFAANIDLKMAAGDAGGTEIDAAMDKISGFSFKEFNEQVRPYLTDELVAAYEDEANYDRMKNETLGKLLELIR